jgi:hypothetical protein
MKMTRKTTEITIRGIKLRREIRKMMKSMKRDRRSNQRDGINFMSL